jgi:UDP-N-acetylglucosamine:LPS N-acetylglucosamine transferase
MLEPDVTPLIKPERIAPVTAIVRESSRRQRVASSRVLLVASTGGHLSTLYALEPWWRDQERVWVTFQQPQARSLLGGERVVWAHHPTTRNAVNALRNLRLAARVFRSFRPNLVVSTGAGVAVPFFVVARLLRIPTVFIEALERLDAPSLTGRLCYPMSDRFLLQSEEQRRAYPHGVVIGRIL